MRKNKILLYENINRIHEISDINPVAGKNLIVVDIQPEYSSYINFLPSFVDFLNSNHENMSSITFLYNGYDTLGMINEGDYKMWWMDQGLDEEVIDSSYFYDKGYAFFRYCIDSNIDDEHIVGLVKIMIEKNVNDTRDLDNDFWDYYIERYGNKDVRELLEFSDDCINIPDLMDYLSSYDNITLCGGGINECLKEVEIALNALDKKYTTIPKFLY
jgi:hypothetical protein